MHGFVFHTFLMTWNKTDTCNGCQNTVALSQTPITRFREFPNLKVDQISVRDMHSAATLHCESNAVDPLSPTPTFAIKGQVKTEVGSRAEPINISLRAYCSLVRPVPAELPVALSPSSCCAHPSPQYLLRSAWTFEQNPATHWPTVVQTHVIADRQ